MIPQVGQTVRRKHWHKDDAVKVLVATNKMFIGECLRDGSESLYSLDHDLPYNSPYTWEEKVKYVPQVGDRVRRSTWDINLECPIVTAIGETRFLGATEQYGEIDYPLDKNWIKVPS